MANPKKSSRRNQSRFNTVPDRLSGKEKNQKMISPNRMIQQKFLKLLTKGFKKSQQFSQKKYKKVTLRFLVTWLLQNENIFLVLF